MYSLSYTRRRVQFSKYPAGGSHQSHGLEGEFLSEIGFDVRAHEFIILGGEPSNLNLEFCWRNLLWKGDGVNDSIWTRLDGALDRDIIISRFLAKVKCLRQYFDQSKFDYHIGIGAFSNLLLGLRDHRNREVLSWLRRIRRDCEGFHQDRVAWGTTISKRPRGLSFDGLLEWLLKVEIIAPWSDECGGRASPARDY